MDFILDILKHVANHEDDKDMLGLNILVKKNVANIEEIVVEKLRRIVFSIKNYDRIAFYLDKLKILNAELPKDIIDKINIYNQHIDFDWQRLIC